MKDEEIDFESAKDTMRQIFASLELDESKDLVKWAQEYLQSPPEIIGCTARLEREERKRKEHQLAVIGSFLKDRGVMKPSYDRVANYPKNGHASDCNETNTLEIDNFLYDEDDIDVLVDERVISRHYCKKCGSKDLEPLNFISHSFAKKQIQFVFEKLLPEEGADLILDVGSRLGAVVYGASIFTDGNIKVVGVERDSELVKVTMDTIKQFKLKNIEIVDNDIRQVPQVVESAQFIIMHNVFSFFMTDSEQEDCWEFMHKHMKKGTILIHHPEIELSTEYLNLSFNVKDWLETVDTAVECIDFAGSDTEVFEDVFAVKKYITVLNACGGKKNEKKSMMKGPTVVTPAPAPPVDPNANKDEKKGEDGEKKEKSGEKSKKDEKKPESEQKSKKTDKPKSEEKKDNSKDKKSEPKNDEKKEAKTDKNAESKEKQEPSKPQPHAPPPDAKQNLITDPIVTPETDEYPTVEEKDEKKDEKKDDGTKKDKDDTKKDKDSKKDDETNGKKE
ncbi:unnamed protein product [Caenorhabditis bovis]|uniref:Methyltransferase domain-containing protein n=1 Tax=Caenorhabditis bovis TaxID=2654633 RepID=A0A8S1ED75_9PELO|nr:unnamed protein product [Caenorhabditis bovis]